MGVTAGNSRYKGKRVRWSVTCLACYLENTDVISGADEQLERITGKCKPMAGCLITQLKLLTYSVGITAAESEKMAKASLKSATIHFKLS